MKPTDEPSWCRAADKLDDRELNLLVEVIASVLDETENAPDWDSVNALPIDNIIDQLTDELKDAGVTASPETIKQVVEQPTVDRQLAIELIRAICPVQPLRAEVITAYEARGRMMVLDPGSVIALSVLLFIIKLRKVRIGREGIEIHLDPIRQQMIGAIKDLLDK